MRNFLSRRYCGWCFLVTGSGLMLWSVAVFAQNGTTEPHWLDTRTVIMGLTGLAIALLGAYAKGLEKKVDSKVDKEVFAAVLRQLDTLQRSVESVHSRIDAAFSKD